MKLSRRIAAIAVATLAFTSVNTGVVRAGETITGSGSTFIKNLFDACAPTFNDARTDGSIVSYSGGGSGAGRTAFTAGTTNFAGTDSTYSSSDTPPADYTYVPVIAGPVSVIFKHTGYSGTLKLSPSTIAKIFSGAITNWNDADITADNGSALPSKTIVVTYRSDSSGTSAGFTAYLRAAAPAVWTKAGSSTFTSSAPSGAPAGSQAKSGSDGVTNYVAATDGAVSYTELSYQLEAAADGVKSAYVKNASGSYIKPTSTAAAAAVSAIPAANFKDTGWVDADFLTTVSTAYPITIFSFGIAHKTYSAANEVVRDYLTYAMTTCASAQASSLGYAQLIGSTLTFAKGRAALISSEGRPAGATTTTIAPKAASVKVGKALTAKAIAKAGKLTLKTTSKVTLKVTKGVKVCKVVGTTVKGLKKGTCSVKASVKTGTKTTGSTVVVTVS